MGLIFLILWATAGLLAYGQFIMNLATSVQFQKELSAKMKTYTGYNHKEVVLMTVFLFAWMMGSIIGGILWFILVQRITKDVINDRLRVEKISYKMFKHGWCL